MYNSKEKITNNDLQNTTQKTKHCITQTQLKVESELKYFGRANSSWFTSDARRFTTKRHEFHLI